jgi:inner membrane transporter RhtA
MPRSTRARRVIGFPERGRGDAECGDADRGGEIPRLPHCQLERATDRRHERAGYDEVREAPDHLVGHLHRHQRQRQDERHAQGDANGGANERLARLHRPPWIVPFGWAAPAELFFVVSAVFHYLGPAFAVLLFARVEPLGVAWLRIASAGAVLALWRRPWRALKGGGREAWPLVLSLGAVLAVMNASFYLAIDRLPLGTVAAIEFLPVIALAALGARSLRNLAALALAVLGVYALVDVTIAGEPLGIALAFANAVLFACYIVLAHRVARSREPARIDGLAAAMLVATLVVTPIGGSSAAPALVDPIALAAGVGVGLASSVIPTSSTSSPWPASAVPPIRCWSRFYPRRRL